MSICYIIAKIWAKAAILDLCKLAFFPPLPFSYLFDMLLRRVFEIVTTKNPCVAILSRSNLRLGGLLKFLVGGHLVGNQVT